MASPSRSVKLPAAADTLTGRGISDGMGDCCTGRVD
jgi:hypothetical protein